MQPVPDKVAAEIAVLFDKSVDAFLSPFELARLRKLIDRLMDFDPALTYSLRSAYEILIGNEKAARFCIENALALGPEHSPAILNCANSLLKLEEGAKAGALLEQAFCIYPQISVLVEMLRLAYCYDDYERLERWSDIYAKATNSIFILYFHLIKFSKNNKIYCRVKNTGHMVFSPAFVLTMENDCGKYLALSDAFPDIICRGATSRQALETYLSAVESHCADRHKNEPKRHADDQKEKMHPCIGYK